MQNKYFKQEKKYLFLFFIKKNIYGVIVLKNGF